MRDYGRRPKRYDSAIGEVIAGGFLTIGGGVYGFVSFASGWLEALIGLGIAAIGGVLLFFGIYGLDKYVAPEEERKQPDFRDKARCHALRNIFFILGWVGVVCFLMVAVHLASEFSWGGLIRAAVCALLTAASMTAGIVFKILRIAEDFYVLFYFCTLLLCLFQDLSVFLIRRLICLVSMPPASFVRSLRFISFSCLRKREFFRYFRKQPCDLLPRINIPHPGRERWHGLF